MKIRYQNEHLRKRVKDDTLLFPETMGITLFGLALVIISIVNTCLDMSFSDEGFFRILSEKHPLSLGFGITLLIMGGIFIRLTRSLNVLKHLRPACGSVSFTPEEIDREADLPESVWYPGYDIYVTPRLIIGTNRGMTAVELDDIQRVRIREKRRTESDRTKSRVSLVTGRKTYRQKEYTSCIITVWTKNGRRLTLCDSRSLSGEVIMNILKERCGSEVLED